MKAIGEYMINDSDQYNETDFHIVIYNKNKYRREVLYKSNASKSCLENKTSDNCGNITQQQKNNGGSDKIYQDEICANESINPGNLGLPGNIIYAENVNIISGTNKNDEKLHYKPSLNVNDGKISSNHNNAKDNNEAFLRQSKKQTRVIFLKIWLLRSALR